MLFQFVVCFLLIAIAVVNGWNQFGFRSNNKMMRTKNTILRVSTDTVVESAPSSGATPEGGSSKKSKDKDYSIYTPGQQIEGTLLSAKQFGIFVKLEQGIDALIPRSTLSRSGYDKLKGMVDAKSKEAVKIELISVNIENKTISAKYLPLVAEESFDLSTLDPKVLKTKLFDATILSAHDFGVFAKVDGVDIDGLVPASLLPDRSGGSIQSLYPAGTRVAVRVSEFNTETKKLTLTMKFSSQDVSAVAKISHEKYFQAAVQKVLSYGLIVRPAGIDVSGLVHVSQIPRSLVTALKKRITVEAGQNKSDVELVFQEGDVMKVRIQSVDVDTNKVEFSLQQYRANEEDEDDYVVEGRETEEELEEAEKNGRDDQDEDLVPYDAEELLLWWRGAAYVKSDASEAAKVDEDLEVIMESTAIVEGTWRRLFEIDLRADEADYSAKAVELDLKEIEEEIGELGGLDDDVTSDPIGFGVGGDKGPRSRAGSFIALSSLPEEWKSQISFLKELETEEQTILKGLKSGKKGESSELASLIAKVEAEAVNAASARSSRRPREEVFAAPAEPAAPAQE